MLRWVLPLVACAAVAAGCSSGSPTGPDVDHATVARLARTRFLAFGDSMTLGEVTMPVGRIISEPGTGFAPVTRQVIVPTVAYPLLLHGHLTARYASQASSIVVTPSGRAGEHPHEGVQRFNDAFAAERPEVVLLFEGANSLRLYGSDLPTLGLGNMVDTALAGGAQVFVATMPPTRAGLLNSPPTIELVAYNRKIAEMAAIKGTRLVNLYDPMLPDAATLIGSDGLHPTEAGYRRIAELFFQAIQSHLEVR